MSSLSLPFDDGDNAESGEAGPRRRNERDEAARARAVDPRFNVALEASAGTGKTRVLVDRYINLLRAGVDPANILAMTFTRKAATEMRERIVQTLHDAAARGEITPVRWRELQDRAGDIAISTIDAFCLSLLREFPLEADLDPGFSVADDSEVPRLVDESLDRALRVCRAVAREDERVGLVFAQLGERRARTGLAALLARRIVAPEILSRFLARGRRDLTVSGAAHDAAHALFAIFGSMAAGSDSESGDGLRSFVMSGPADPAFMLFVKQLEQLELAVRSDRPPDPRLVFAVFARAREYFLTRQGEPRARLVHPRAAFASDAHWRRHRELVAGHAAAFSAALRAYRHDINVLVSGGVWRMFKIAESEYRRTLDAHAVLDFSDLLLRALELLRRMEEFARSRYRLEARYHHVLVDEFQDTSRAQWELIALLVEAWGEGVGLAHTHPLPPSIFIVGDRKQSIYGFRDADVSVMGDAIRFLQGLRPDRDVRRSIARSFRSVPALLSFVNDVCHDVEKVSDRRDAFEYGEDDRFPIDAEPDGSGRPDMAGPEGPALRSHLDPAIGDEALGVVLGESLDVCARVVASEIARLIESGATIRDVATGVRRAVRPGDVAILFRTRDSHRAFEDALERRGIASYVYKGLGFFDSDEVRDVLALLGFLANPGSNLRAAALLRSGFVRLSDEGLRRIGPNLAAALTAADVPADSLDADDARLLRLSREACRRWLARVDLMSHAELLDLALSESAYAIELRGPRARQARENLKKVRGLVRRAQNTGYTTLGRIVTYLDRLAIGDESNAAIDAADAVNLMTVHAAKGLEFPVVFVVNLTRGTGGRRPPIRVTMTGDDEVSVSVGDFQSSSDEDDPTQEREETKRLLYVALTRARDRLYLSSALTDGRVLPGRGSLGEVLPGSLLNQFAAVSGEIMSWRASGGGVHTLRVVRSSDECSPGPFGPGHEVPDADRRPRSATDAPGETGAASAADVHPCETDFAPLPALPPSRVAVRPAVATNQRVQASERLVGTLVHRLVQRCGLSADVDREALARTVRQLLRPEERALVENVDELGERAADFFRDMCGRPDVCRLYEAGEVWHEVPFSLVKDGARFRGSIDCIVARRTPRPGREPAGHERSLQNAGAANAPEDGFESVGELEHLSILEFKTGRERVEQRDEHLAQVALYREAIGAIFPGVLVTAAIVYADRIVVR